MYNIGDRVRVKERIGMGRIYCKDDSHIVYNTKMDEFVGKTFTISNIVTFHGIYPVYEFEDCYMMTAISRWDWKFVDEWLEYVGSEITIDDSDIDNVFKEI